MPGIIILERDFGETALWGAACAAGAAIEYNSMARVPRKHRKRIEKLHIEDDITYCLTPNQTDVVPVMVGDAIYNLAVLQSM